MAMQRPLYDLTAPSENELATALHEHVFWDGLSSEATLALTTSKGSTPAAQHVARTVSTSMQQAPHVIEKMVPFSRCARLDGITACCQIVSVYNSSAKTTLRRLFGMLYVVEATMRLSACIHA